MKAKQEEQRKRDEYWDRLSRIYPKFNTKNFGRGKRFVAELYFCETICETFGCV